MNIVIILKVHWALSVIFSWFVEGEVPHPQRILIDDDTCTQDNKARITTIANMAITNIPEGMPL